MFIISLYSNGVFLSLNSNILFLLTCNFSFESVQSGSLSPAQLITTTASSSLTESTDAHALELENNLLVLAATAEQSSDHPLSRAILHAAKERHLKLFALAEDATVMFVGEVLLDIFFRL